MQEYLNHRLHWCDFPAGLYVSHFCLIVIQPGAMFSQPYDWEDMKRHLDKTLNAWQSTPFVLGVADQVLPDGDITMVTKISDFVRNRRPRAS